MVSTGSTCCRQRAVRVQRLQPPTAWGPRETVNCQTSRHICAARSEGRKRYVVSTGYEPQVSLVSINEQADCGHGAVPMAGSEPSRNAIVFLAIVWQSGTSGTCASQNITLATHTNTAV